MQFGGFGFPYSKGGGFGSVIPNTTVATSPGFGGMGKFGFPGFGGGLGGFGKPFGGFGKPFGGYPASKSFGKSSKIPNASFGSSPYGIW